MKKNQRIWLVLSGIILLLLIAGVPIIINECYKTNRGYITLWGASDVLSYYGMIIAALVGVAGVYFAVHISNKQYREDARNRILPIIAINTITQTQSDSFLSELDNAFSTQEALLEQVNAWLFFLVGTKGVAVLREPQKGDLEMIIESNVVWKRGTTDERMYVRDSENVYLPLEIENVGNGIANRLCVGFHKIGEKVHYEAEISLKRDEKRKIIIYSREQFNDIEGQYSLSVEYCDIANNRYAQEFPVELATNERGRRLKSVNLFGMQHIIGRETNHADA